MRRRNLIKIIGIYKIVNQITNQCYIGSSIDIIGRLYKHKSWLKNNKHQNKHLQNAVNKYKFENFTFEILEECSKENLEILEQKYIDNIGYYNITKIVDRNILSKESRKLQSNTRKERIKSGEIKLYTKKIYQYNLNGDFIKEHNSLNEATLSVNGHVSTLIRCLNNTYKSALGYYWSYTFLGNKIQSIKAKLKSKYIDLVKLDKLLETPEEDNQQPTTNLNDQCGFND